MKTKAIRLARNMILLPVFMPLVILAILCTFIICIAISLEDLASGRNPFRRP